MAEKTVSDPIIPSQDRDVPAAVDRRDTTTAGRTGSRVGFPVLGFGIDLARGMFQRLQTELAGLDPDGFEVGRLVTAVPAVVSSSLSRIGAGLDELADLLNAQRADSSLSRHETKRIRDDLLRAIETLVSPLVRGSFEELTAIVGLLEAIRADNQIVKPLGLTIGTHDSTALPDRAQMPGGYAADVDAPPAVVATADFVRSWWSRRGEQMSYLSRLLAGEDQPNNVSRVEHQYTYAYLTAEAQVKGSSGFVHSIHVVCTTAGTVTLYNSLTEAAPVIDRYVMAINTSERDTLDVLFTTGLYVGFDATFAGSVRVSYR